MQNRPALSKFKILSGSMLKLIAVITMLIDHSALLLAPQISLMSVPFFTIGSHAITIYYIMRKIGRLSFPIFCFLISEGFSYTRNQKRYAINLLIFAFISEIPYNIMKSGNLLNFKAQNIFFTLFFGVVMIYIYQNFKNTPLKVALMLLTCAAAIILKVDYGIVGTLLILFMFVLRDRPVARTVLAFPLLSGGYTTLAVFIPINMYNGKRGFIKSGFIKYAFYLFYPIHILVLIAIKLILK